MKQAVHRAADGIVSALPGALAPARAGVPKHSTKDQYQPEAC